MKPRSAVLSLSLVLFGATLPRAFPQADVSTATLKGTVTDPTGAVVSGATVKAGSIEKGITREARTDAQGVYQIPFLQPGAYDVRVEASGFETQLLKNVQLTVGQIGLYDVQMRVGAVSSEVVIQAAAALVETEKVQQANTIQSSQIENFPNITRNFFAPVYTLPGFPARRRRARRATGISISPVRGFLSAEATGGAI